jgi:hypothetical protein
MGSSNGTFLDGKRIKEAVLYTGGELRIGDGDVYMSVRVDEPEARLESATLIALPDGEAARRELERERDAARAELEQLTKSLEESRNRIVELEAERTSAPRDVGPSEAQLEAQAALERANAELKELRAQVAALQAQESKPAVPLSPAAELFLKLQSENSTLKRRLAEVQGKPGAGAPSSVPSTDGVQAKLLAEIVELRAQNAGLRAQGGAPSPRSSSSVRGLFTRLAKDDVDRQSPLLSGPFEDFLVIEQFRLVRNVERIVTRVAGDAIELFDAKTMLPSLHGSQGKGIVNLRQLISRLAESNEDPDARAELLQYCAQLSRWLVAALGAERKAATAFAIKLKLDLGEEALTSRAAIPALKRLSGQGEAELWRRASTYLRELTPDMIQDRLEKLARAAALELVGEEGAPRA